MEGGDVNAEARIGLVGFRFDENSSLGKRSSRTPRTSGARPASTSASRELSSTRETSARGRGAGMMEAVEGGVDGLL
jgi:hypothetical protein